ASAIKIVEITACEDGNAKRSEEPGRDDPEIRARILFTRSSQMAVRRELKPWTGACIAPRNEHTVCGLIHAGERINATHQFFVEIDDLLLRLSKGHCGNIHDQDALCVKTRLRPLQCDQRCEQRTCPGQQHERCGDLCDREETLAVARAAGNACAPTR